LRSGAVNVKLQEDHKEQEEMKRRKNNTAADPAERRSEDELQIMSLLHDIDCDDSSLDSVIRLGRIPEADDAKPRPILLRFASEEQKDKVLAKSKNLKTTRMGGAGRIFIHQDLTPNQRECRRKLVDELKQRTASGETNLIIWNGKVVQRRMTKAKPRETVVRSMQLQDRETST